MPVVLPRQPFAEFPLRAHRNGQWYKSVWNPLSRRSVQHYFGAWKDDPKGERALHDPQLGWLARRPAIKAGTDNIRVPLTESVITLGGLMGRFLTYKRGLVLAGELSARTLGDYIREMEKFVAFLKPSTPAERLRPEHFSAYMKYMIEERKLGRYARRRVRTYVNTMLRYGTKNGWFPMPSTGTDWAAPATDPDSMRQARLRSGQRDFSDRILTGQELNQLLTRARPAFKAIILIGVNCGLGPADIGRLRWSMIDMKTGHMTFPRPKTGVMRHGYLWKKTRKHLLCVRALRQNREALEREGESSLVFLTRNNLPYYREREVHRDIVVDGRKVTKLVGIAIENAVSITFRRMVRELKLEGVSFYRLRHTFKTLAKRARDKEAIDLMMGHKDRSVGKTYDHEQVEWERLRHVSKVVYQRLWPRIIPSAGTPTPKGTNLIGNADAGEYALVPRR